jgi:hypothetical protein
VVAGALLALALVLLLAYHFYTDTRARILKERNQRALASAAKQIGSRIDALRIALETDGRPEIAPGNTGWVEKPWTPLAIPGLDIEPRLPWPGVPGEGPKGDEAGPPTIVALDRHDSPALVLAYEPCADPSARCPSPRQCATPPSCAGSRLTCQSTNSGRRCASMDLASEIERTWLGDDGQPHPFFDGLLVVDSARRVLLGLGDGRYEKRVPGHERSRQGSEASQASEHGETEWVGLAPGKEQERTFLGLPYLFFTERVPVWLPSTRGVNPTGVRLYLIALVRSDRLTGEAQSAPQRYVQWLVVLVVVVLASWPLLKLWFLGPTERLSGIDVRLLALSVLVIAAVLTVSALEPAAEHRLQHALDAQLTALAEQVEGGVRTYLTHGAANVRLWSEHKGPGIRLPHAEWVCSDPGEKSSSDGQRMMTASCARANSPRASTSVTVDTSRTCGPIGSGA